MHDNTNERVSDHGVGGPPGTVPAISAGAVVANPGKVPTPITSLAPATWIGVLLVIVFVCICIGAAYKLRAIRSDYERYADKWYDETGHRAGDSGGLGRQIDEMLERQFGKAQANLRDAAQVNDALSTGLKGGQNELL